MSSMSDSTERDGRLPPWSGGQLTPRSIIAWLTHDPLTRANMGEAMADHVIEVLRANGFEIMKVTHSKRRPFAFDEDVRR